MRGLAGLADGLVERHRGARGLADDAHLLDRQLRLGCDLVLVRLALQAEHQRALGAVDLLEALDDVHGEADRAALVGERAGHRLTDPPGRVGRELEVAAPVELLDRADQAEDALLDQIQEAQALTAVVLRDRHDEAQVRLDHAALGEHVAGLDALGELDLLDLGQQRIAADLGQEALERVGGAVGDGQDDGPALLGVVLVAYLNAHAVELARGLLDGHRLVAGLCECLVDLGQRYVATFKPTLDKALQLGRKCGVLSGDHGVLSTPRRSAPSVSVS